MVLNRNQRSISTDILRCTTGAQCQLGMMAQLQQEHPPFKLAKPRISSASALRSPVIWNCVIEHFHGHAWLTSRSCAGRKRGWYMSPASNHVHSTPKMASRRYAHSVEFAARQAWSGIHRGCMRCLRIRCAWCSPSTVLVEVNRYYWFSSVS